jgi:hypothetical protein
MRFCIISTNVCLCDDFLLVEKYCNFVLRNAKVSASGSIVKQICANDLHALFLTAATGSSIKVRYKLR